MSKVFQITRSVEIREQPRLHDNAMATIDKSEGQYETVIKIKSNMSAIDKALSFVHECAHFCQLHRSERGSVSDEDAATYLEDIIQGAVKNWPPFLMGLNELARNGKPSSQLKHKGE